MEQGQVGHITQSMKPQQAFLGYMPYFFLTTGVFAAIRTSVHQEPE